MIDYFEMAKALKLDEAIVTVEHFKFRGADVSLVKGWSQARDALMDHIPYKHRLAYITGYSSPNFPVPAIPINVGWQPEGTNEMAGRAYIYITTRDHLWTFWEFYGLIEQRFEGTCLITHDYVRNTTSIIFLGEGQ